MNVRKHISSALGGAMSRRAFIGALPVVGASMAIPVAAAEASHPDLQNWLDTAPVEAVVLYHLSRMTEALHRQHGGTWKGVHLVDVNVAMAVQMDKTGDAVWIEPNGGKHE